MAQASYPPRGTLASRLPDRTVPSSSQPQFGQSAPGFGRPAQFSQQLQQPGYNSYSQYTAGAGYGTVRGQVQLPMGHVAPGLEKESNVMNDLSEEQRDEINEAFTIFDLDKDRHLDLHELRVAFRALGFNLEKPEVAQLMAANGIPKPNAQMTSATGRTKATIHPSQMIIGQVAFTRLAAQKMNERDPRDEVDRAFYLFDADHKDYISLDDLKRVTRELGETSLEEQELMTMIEEFDYEGIGGISKDAFFGICLQ